MVDFKRSIVRFDIFEFCGFLSFAFFGSASTRLGWFCDVVY